MKVLRLLIPILIGGSLFGAPPDTRAGRLVEAVSDLTDPEKTSIGRLICGRLGFELTESGLRCHGCPSITGLADSAQGLEISYVGRGRFSGAKRDELLLDTLGCEARFANFGGAMLLYRAAAKPLLGSPTAVLGGNLVAKPAPGKFSFAFYQPGVRLDDCLSFKTEKSRVLLVCNEEDTAQGETIGHISAMRISKRAITRWRLLSWYDSSATESATVLTVKPTHLRAIGLDDDGGAGLQIRLAMYQGPAERADKDGKDVRLLFNLEGHRFFATSETQRLLAEINTLIQAALE